MRANVRRKQLGFGNVRRGARLNFWCARDAGVNAGESPAWELDGSVPQSRDQLRRREAGRRAGAEPNRQVAMNTWSTQAKCEAASSKDSTMKSLTWEKDGVKQSAADRKEAILQALGHGPHRIQWRPRFLLARECGRWNEKRRHHVSASRPRHPHSAGGQDLCSSPPKHRSASGRHDLPCLSRTSPSSNQANAFAVPSPPLEPLAPLPFRSRMVACRLCLRPAASTPFLSFPRGPQVGRAPLPKRAAVRI